MASRHQNAHSRANSGSRTDAVTWVGGSCGRHGSYVFYKAFRFRLAPPEPSTPTSTGRSRTRRSLSTRSDEHQEEVAPERESGHSSLIQERILSLGEFFFVQCRPEDPVCVGEIQLLWQDKHSGQDLASTRLYYLPETTPAGRTSQHGEDEMLAVSEKIVMRIGDLASWIVEPQEWNYGSSLLITPPPKNGGSTSLSSSPLHRYSMLHSCVNMNDVNVEKKALLLSTANGLVNQPQSAVLSPDKTSSAPVPDLAASGEAPSHPLCCTPRTHKAEVVMLGMNAYCRHKTILKRMSQTDRAWMARPGARAILGALGAVTSENPKARVVFCRDTFDYPQLFEHDLICEELAPVFKGRPRKKNKKNGALSAKGATKKVTNGAKSICRAADSPVDLAKHETDASTPTRRSSGRRRSKRKSPQNLAYEDQYLPSLARSSKRTRRTSARTPTPVSEAGGEKETSSLSPDLASSDAGRGYITAATVAQTIDVVAQSTAVDSLVGRKKGKGNKRARRRRSSATALDIAIKNSLLINHKPTSWSAEVESLASRKTPSGSANSSRSSSPSTELLLPGNQSSPKATSPAGSSASSAPPNAYASSSSAASSPVDFAPLTYSADEQDKPQRASSASPSPGTDLLLHGLMDDRIPENKSTFLDKLYQFMRKRNTPIGRIPSLGFKKLDLWAFFKLSQEYGGYDMVTAKRLWKHVYDRMGGNPSCTSAATCTRKHFEKLLLPFEMHLRQQLRITKEPEAKEKRSGGSDDSVLGSANSEILNGKENTITQRTYNGDAYFINGAKTKLSSTTNTTSSILEDTDHSVTSQAKTNGFHDNLIKTTSASSVENLPTPLPKVARPLPSSVHHQSAFVDFETLAHNVIRDELITSRVSPVARNSPEDLSACRKLSGESPKLPVVRTSSNERSLLTRTPTVRVQSPVTFQPNVTSNMTSQLPIPTPIVSPLPLSAAQFSRASVIVGGSKNPPHPAPESRSSLMTSFRPLGSNRYAAAPPPFVPTKSKFTPANAGNPPVVHVDLTRPLHGVAPSPEPRAIVIGQEKNDRLRLQKRPLDDAHTPATLRAVSPASPKRARADPSQPLPQPLPKTASPSGYRRHDIRNLFLNESKPEESDAGREPKPFYVPSNFAARTQNAIKVESMLGSSQYGRVPPGPRQPRPSFVDPRRLEESQRPVIVKPDVRPRPVPGPVAVGGEPKRHLNGTSGLQLNRDGRARPVSPPKQHVELSREAPRKESYYRPCSMLSYRQQWQQKDNQQPPSQSSANSKELHRPHIKPSEKHSPVITNGASRPTELGEKTPNLYSSRPRSPYEQRPSYKREQELQHQQQQQRKPFQSSFSVDRLTSDTRKNHHPYPANKDNKPHILHSAQESVHKPLPQLPPHGFLKAPDRKISQPSGPGHMESYKLERHPEPPRRPEPPRPSDFAGFQAKPEPHKRQQATVAPMPSTHSSPAKDSSPLSATANAFLSSLPPAVASAMYPLIPKDCTPKMLDQILQEAIKSMGLSHMQQHSSQLLHAEMQEALIRQQLDAAPFRIITHQEQQAAAASQLARVAMIGSQVAHPDPMTAQMYQAYQNLFLARHMQEAASAGPSAGPSAAAAAAAAQSLKLGQLANRDALLGLTPGRGAPPHLSVGASTHLSPSVRNPAVAFPSQPPHYPADFGLPYTRR